MYLYITDIDLSQDNGPGINEREFVDALVAQTDDVVCIAPLPAAPERYSNPRVHYIDMGRGGKLRKQALFASGLLKFVSSLAQPGQVRGVATRLGMLPIVPALVSRRLKVPLLLKTLAGYGIFSAEAEPRFRAIAWGLRPLYQYAISRAVIADTVSHAYVRWLQEEFRIPPDRLTLIPNGANTTTFRPGERSEARRIVSLERFDVLIGYVGALHGWRNLPQLIDAFAQASLPDGVGLVFVGEGPSRQDLQAQVNARGLADRVVFTGHVPYTTVPVYMQALDVAVDLTVIDMKLRDGSSVVGSFSQKIPQYLASGLPVLAWDVPDNRFIADEDLGALARYRHDRDLVDAIERLTALDPDSRVQMGGRSRRYAEEHFSAAALARRRLDLWQQVS